MLPFVVNSKLKPLFKMEKVKPKLRFPKFSTDWKINKLGEISIKINSGKTPLGGESVYTESGILFIRSQNVLDSKLSFENPTYIDEKINNTMKNSIVKSNDILLNITGASLGRSCVVPKDFNVGNVNQHVCIIRLNSVNNSNYIQSILASDKGQTRLKNLSTGSGREGLNFQSIKDLEVYLSSLEEQTQIANFLSSVDEKLNLLKDKKSLLEDYKKGIMQKIFNKEIRFKDDNGNDFEDWENKTLGKVGSVLNGLTYSPDDISEEGVLVLRSSNIKDNRLKFEDNVFVNKNNFTAVVENDILICVRNGSRNLIGKNTLITKEIEGVAFGAFMSVYRSNYNRFLIHWFGSGDFFENVNLNLGATINSINGSDLKKFKIPFPCAEEQNKIANFLSAIDEKIALVSNQIEDTQEYKKGLLQQMFV